jgi:RNA polymerase sigma factor (sigma-70 family)
MTGSVSHSPTLLDSLVERAKLGDEVAIERLLEQCEPALHRLAQRVCPASEADDAVQEVLWRVATRVGRLRLTGAFLVWAMRMLVRECLRLRRRASRYLFGAVEVATVWDNVTLDLTRALSSLDATSREVVIQRDLLGRTASETAMLMGASVESTKSRLRRAREQLRVFLEPRVRASVGSSTDEAG